MDKENVVNIIFIIFIYIYHIIFIHLSANTHLGSLHGLAIAVDSSIAY